MNERSFSQKEMFCENPGESYFIPILHERCKKNKTQNVYFLIYKKSILTISDQANPELMQIKV